MHALDVFSKRVMGVTYSQNQIRHRRSEVFALVKSNLLFSTSIRFHQKANMQKVVPISIKTTVVQPIP